MKDKLLTVLDLSIGNGLVKNIISARGTGADVFLFEKWQEYIREHYPNSKIIDARKIDNKELRDVCTNCKETNVHCFILVKHIWSYVDFDSIINICAGHSNIDLFSISYSKRPIFSSEKWTLIRGRLYSIYFPSTLYEDYLSEYPNGNVIKYLAGNNLDSDVITLNLQQLNKEEKMCLRLSLQYYNTPLTYRTLASEMSKRIKKDFSRYYAQMIFSRFEEMNILYLIERFDIKRNKIISGKLVYPIDNRFYDFFNYNKDLNKFMTSAFIAKMFYDNWNIQKGIYVSQRDGKTFNGNTDAGFIVKKEDQTFILFITEYINGEVIKKAKLAPTNLPKIIVTLDIIGDIQRDNDGLIYYSYEKLLKEGLKIYDK